MKTNHIHLDSFQTIEVQFYFKILSTYSFCRIHAVFIFISNNLSTILRILQHLVTVRYCIFSDVWRIGELVHLLRGCSANIRKQLYKFAISTNLAITHLSKSTNVYLSLTCVCVHSPIRTLYKFNYQRNLYIALYIS